MKRIFIFILIYLQSIVVVFAQEESGASPNIKTFALNPNNKGAGVNSVNLFTGDVALPIPLLSLPGHNGLDVGVNISYSSNVQEQVSTWNLEAPTGILGLGWGMDMPKIVVDHKQNGAREDDEFYLIEGGGSTQLIRTTEGSDVGGSFLVYETKSYQLWKIKYYATSDKWEITKEDGTKYIYGDKNSNRQTIQWVVRWDNWIGNSAVTSNQTQMAQAWNLSEIVNLWNEKITFEYENDENFVGSTAGKKQTEASYLKRITDVLGRKVEFNYKLKTDISPFLVQEPHIEQAEPDAYQEFYERRYLDCIKVLEEDNSLHFSIHFTYAQLNAGTHTAKLLLTSITQKNKDDYALPPMQFEYYMSDVSNGRKGFLKTITSPTGATTLYTYKTNTLSYSNRGKRIYAPPADASSPYGYAEPQFWIGEDYVVVCWRALNATSNSHTFSKRPVKLYVYQWVGEWREQFVSTLNDIEVTNVNQQTVQRYENFQISIQKDFFSILYRTISETNYNLIIAYKDELLNAKWKNYNSSLVVDNKAPTLLTGTNFVAVSPHGSGKLYTYTYKGNGFTQAVSFTETNGEFYSTATNNYIFRHDEDGNPDHLYFYYLSESKTWNRKTLPSSIRFNSGNPSNWYSSNSFSLGMIAGFPEYIYRWDINYNNFYRDNVIGSYHENSQVFMLNNTMIAIKNAISNGTSFEKRIARFDGMTWRTLTDASIGFPSYGDDYYVRYNSPNNTQGYRQQFNPNTLTWQSNVFTIANTNYYYSLSTGIDYFFIHRECYFRQTNGQWNRVFIATNNLVHNRFSSGYPRFNIAPLSHSLSPQRGSTQVYSIKNGAVLGSGSVISNSDMGFYNNKNGNFKYFQKPSPVGFQTAITIPTNFLYIEDAKELQLNRLVNNEILNQQVDYAVETIIISDGTTNLQTVINYDIQSSTVDPSGTTTQYHKVTVANGTSTPNSYPQGRTEYYFYNGLTQAEVSGNTTLPISNSYALWTGTPYETKVYNASNQLLSSSKTTLSEPMTKVLNNSLGNQVGVAYYVRPIEVIETQEGVSTKKTFAYNTLGQLKSEIAEDVMYRNFSLGVPNTKSAIFTTYEYLHEKYNTSSTNQVSPTVSSKTQIKAWNPNNSTWIDETVLSFSANTWKQENGIWRPHKTYVWRRTGTPTFNFASWSGTGEPPSTEWTKVSEIDQIDSKGNVLQTTVR